jgi:hypothetical protein
LPWKVRPTKGLKERERERERERGFVEPVLGGYQKQEYRPPAVIRPVLGGFITTVLSRNKDWVLVYNQGANLFLKIKIK